jgi:hypothetical protein
MIGFMHDGHFYCANVHRYRHGSSVEYHVTILTNKTRPDIPSRLVLEELNRGDLVLVSGNDVPPSFLENIFSEIGKHDHKPH